MSTSFADLVRTAISRTAVSDLLAEHPAVVLERIARGAGATRWFHLASANDLERLYDKLSPGSVVSFYFDDRIQQTSYGDEAVVRIFDLISVYGDAVVGTLGPDDFEIDVESIAGANELDEFADGAPAEANVFVGAFPAAENDGRNAVTLTLQDSDGLTRAHPH